MFNLREFIKNGLLRMFDTMTDDEVLQCAKGWRYRGVLTTDDLALFTAKVEARRAAKEQ